MRRRYLPRLVGGPFDGELRELDPQTRAIGRLVLPEMTSRPPRVRFVDGVALPQAMAYRTHTYVKRKLAFDGEVDVLEVFAHESLDERQVGRRLWTHLLDRAGAHA